VELPPEMAELEEQRRTTHQLKIALFHTLFDFTINRNIFNTVPMTDDQVKHATCEDMFCPRSENTSLESDSRRCIFSDHAGETGGALEIDLKEENLVYIDMSTRSLEYECERIGKFEIDDEWELGSKIRAYHRGIFDYSATKGCIMLCPLVLPTVEQVSRLQVQ
jgi:hypothetical protein